ncbi:uncharacterized protein DUF4332 [Chitinophaga skermanii]|uniref:Uncharacterized protein DUF4332 n=1 Tax=Chitinophaga skermanii TaxID=331697 RepID=A0A327R4A5_9BACT|nr:DUF4332 domain-containing protein [Chitinophaga skermanii]RAJ10604.1 uncharacterized protein DUF4332 [Chitinophaga skermanii]
MSYAIHEIEGIGSTYASKLQGVGINTVEKLLEDGASKSGRSKLTETTGIPEKLILKWVNHADLMRINGVGGQFAELLEAAGVDTVRELRNRVPANLHQRLADVNDTKNLVGRIPSLNEITEMIEQAKTLSPGITY